MAELPIEQVSTEILDIPIRRPHHFSVQTITCQSIVLVRIRSGGLEGTGEGITPAGPWWGGDSVETIATIVDRYLAPILQGEDATRIEYLIGRMNRLVTAHHFAKAAVEMALHDLVARSMGRPLHQLLGGAIRTSLPVTWALANGDATKDIAEAQEKIESGLHRTFKIKAGAAADPETDIQRIEKIAAALGEGRLAIVDPNGSWDETTANRYLPRLRDAGIRYVEQPLPGWDLDGMSRLTARGWLPLMADESACSLHDAHQVAARRAADAIALKMPKSGGILATKKMAAVAEAAGIRGFGASTLETGLLTATSLQVFATIPNLVDGCELFGPLWLADDIVTESPRYADGQIQLPDGPGAGVTLDEDKINKYRRRG